MGGVRRVCAWCGVALDWGDDSGDPAALISHGICSDCVREHFSLRSRSLGEFLESLEAPVLVMDQRAVVLEANASARSVLGKESPAIVGHRGGEVIECALSQLPGGCGQQERCRTGCVIRRSVASTASTGTGVHSAMSIHQIQTSEGIREKHIAISTEKVGEVVLLRIDSAEGPDEIDP